MSELEHRIIKVLLQAVESHLSHVAIQNRLNMGVNYKTLTRVLEEMKAAGILVSYRTAAKRRRMYGLTEATRAKAAAAK